LAIESIAWNREGAADRLARLYGGNPTGFEIQADAIGQGEATVFVGVDHRPWFGWCGRHGGLAHRRLARLARTAERRSAVHGFHASETEDDMLWFAAELLDHPVEQYLPLKELAVRAASSAPPKTLSEVFQALEQRSTYVLLRGWDELPDGLGRGREDLDLLVDDPAPLLASFPRLWKKHVQSHRVQYHLPLARRGLRRPWIQIDVRRVGDDYYDAQWQRGMLARRIRDDRGFYRLADADYFDAILYHALLHKPRIRDDYRRLLGELGGSVCGWSERLLDDPPAALAFLASRRPIQRPRDHSVCWNQSLVDGAREPHSFMPGNPGGTAVSASVSARVAIEHRWRASRQCHQIAAK
jgi:hypothetical protein